MKQAKLYLIYMIAIVLGSCSEKHLITNEEYRDLVEKRFDERKELAANRAEELFKVFDKGISTSRSEALKFLFAFMPLSDLADYNGDFFLANADLSLRSKEETQWGKSIPEEIFLHYVLPVRVNNENLDSFRIVYYDEIMDRIKMMDLKEAALEINHWCHEKVAYQPADIRTSSPMNTILSARGRCGEESTLAVAALRTAGIPARQVYTPRWAHSDDNHAWVEIWDNGEWFYMGACEPEPVLDRGWFTEPARRAMLVHTKSFGAHYGNENFITKNKYYTEVNNLKKYAVTKRIYVKVSDDGGLPVPDANVEYKLYNYSEFYPLALVPTDENGISQFETGLGDLLIWASADGLFDFAKISVDETDTVFLKTGRNIEDGVQLDMDLSVPASLSPLPGISPELKAENEKRIAAGNLLRNNYIRSWVQPEEAKSIAKIRDMDTARVMEAVSRSMGNYQEIISFISLLPDSLTEKAFLMLEVLPDKDLRDIKAVVLTDHLYYCSLPAEILERTGNRFYVDYVLNPRVSNEMIVPWRSYFRSALPERLIEQAPADPSMIVRYIDEHVRIENDENYYNTPLSPVGVHELKISDSWSRAICFVAICRSLGIPSRLEEGRLIPQYFLNEKWIDVCFSDQTPSSDRKGYIRFKSDETRPVPEYYIHFTIARFEEGRYVTLAYDYNRKLNDFRDEIALPPGKYMLVTGNRISDSKILTNLMFFHLKENEHRDLIIKLRKHDQEKVILGKLDPLNTASLFGENKDLLPEIKKRGVVIIWIDPDREPTRHIFKDLPLLKAELDAWGGYFLFLHGKPFPEGSSHPSALKGLPANSLFGNDIELEFLSRTMDIKTPADESLPFVLVSDRNGNIVFTSAGYRIGIGEQILKYVQ